MTSHRRIFLSGAAFALIAASLAQAATRSADVLPDAAQAASSASASEVAHDYCNVQVVRDVRNAEANILRTVRDNGECVCVVHVGQNPEAEPQDALRTVLLRRECGDAAPIAQQPIAAAGGLPSGLILIGLGIGAGGALIGAGGGSAGGIDSPG